MQLEDKIRFALSTVRPMAEYTLPYVASVIGVLDGGRRGEHVGSGLRCTLRGRRVLVTALHVIDKAMSYPAVAVSAGYGVPPELVHGEVVQDEEADLAVYFLPESYAASAGRVAFWPEERIDRGRDRLATDYLFVHGFPCVKSAFSPQATGIVSKSLPYGVMQRLDGLPDDLRPFEFALDFDPRQIRVEPGESGELPDPHGLSGAPVWRIGASGRSVKDWTADWSLLVGIVTQWRKEAEILVATSATRLLELLQHTKA
jgi:hypothetical protein